MLIVIQGAQRRRHTLNSTHAHSLNRTSSYTTFTPKLTRCRGRSSNQSSVINQSSSINQSSTTNHSSISTKEKKRKCCYFSSFTYSPPSDPPHRSQLSVSSLPFDCPSDDEQNQKYNMGITTRVGKMKKDVVLSYFTLRSDGRHDCNICHQIIPIISLKIE